jgi:hypothetical protein
MINLALQSIFVRTSKRFLTCRKILRHRLPLRQKAYCGFLSPSAGFEPANLVSNGMYIVTSSIDIVVDRDIITIKLRNPIFNNYRYSYAGVKFKHIGLILLVARRQRKCEEVEGITESSLLFHHWNSEYNNTLLNRKRNEEILEDLHVIFLEEKLYTHGHNWFQHVHWMEDYRLPKQLLISSKRKITTWTTCEETTRRCECWDRNRPPWSKFVMEYNEYDDDDDMYEVILLTY